MGSLYSSPLSKVRISNFVPSVVFGEILII